MVRPGSSSRKVVVLVLAGVAADEILLLLEVGRDIDVDKRILRSQRQRRTGGNCNNQLLYLITTFRRSPACPEP